jgi:hypothetical protein
MIKEMTATVALVSSLGTIGYSDSAKYVYDQKINSYNELQIPEFYFSLMKRVMPELHAIAHETSEAGWDGYGALPVHNGTVEQAQSFLELLPNGIPSPSIGAEPDGQITFEWYKSSRRTLSISVSPTGELHYAALFGLSKAYGTETFYGDVPEKILELIGRVYSI